jgi:hypothetical protein
MRLSGVEAKDATNGSRGTATGPRFSARVARLCRLVSGVSSRVPEERRAGRVWVSSLARGVGPIEAQQGPPAACGPPPPAAHPWRAGEKSPAQTPVGSPRGEPEPVRRGAHGSESPLASPQPGQGLGALGSARCRGRDLGAGARVSTPLTPAPPAATKSAHAPGSDHRRPSHANQASSPTTVSHNRIHTGLVTGHPQVRWVIPRRSNLPADRQQR